MTEEQGAELIRGMLGEQWMVKVRRSCSISLAGKVRLEYWAGAERLDSGDFSGYLRTTGRGDSLEDAVTQLLERAQKETP